MLDAVWRDNLAACWKDTEEEDASGDLIEIYEIVGVDTAPESGQKSVHGRLATLSGQEAREKYDRLEDVEAAVSRSADAA